MLSDFSDEEKKFNNKSGAFTNRTYRARKNIELPKYLLNLQEKIRFFLTNRKLCVILNNVFAVGYRFKFYLAYLQ